MCLFRRVHKNDILFLKMCVFFTEFAEIIFSPILSDFRKKSSDFPNKYIIFLKFRFVFMFVFAARVRVRVQFVVRGSAVR